MDSLFSQNRELHAPLAHRMRPRSLDEYIGQSHLIGKDQFFTKIFQSPMLPSLILWGPPGSGKTTLAYLLASKKEYQFTSLSAVTAGIKDIKEIVAEAQKRLDFHGQKTILFLDEIHRFNKAQQDSLLPHIEKGTITLIGATTENPSFEVISPLLSRCKVMILNKLSEQDLLTILDRTLDDKERGLGRLEIKVMPEAKNFLCQSCEGDARRLLNTLEIAVNLKSSKNDDLTITPHDIEEALQKKALPFDKNGEEHYNLISAFIKSMRGSDPHAAVYYLARLLEAGEEPLFVARRMVIFASEDIGNADPQAIQVAIACMQAFDFVGLPEGWIPLAQSATYLASAPKSNASYLSYKKAKEDVKKWGALPTPLHLRNAPTSLMKDLGYGKNYQYAHNNKDHIVAQQHLPDELKGKRYYIPTDIGYEKQIQEWLVKVEKKNNV